VFGRRKDDEDPFAALRDGATFQSRPTNAADIGLGAESTPRPAAVATPSASAAPAAPAAPAVRAATPAAIPAPAARPAAPAIVPTATTPTAFSSYSRAYRPGNGAMVRLVVVAVIVAAVAIPLVTAVNHTVHSIKLPAFNDGTAGKGFTPSTPSAPSAPSRTSYLHSSSLLGALRRIDAIAPHSSLSLLRLDSRSLSTTAVLRGGRAKLIYFGPSGTFVSSAAVPSEQAVSTAEIRPSAINRIVVTMRRQFHVRAIDYMVLAVLPSRGASWIVFAKANRHRGYAATLSGTRLAPL
jgi:hypothetical protein